jgi:hypothetical protein
MPIEKLTKRVVDAIKPGDHREGVWPQGLAGRRENMVRRIPSWSARAQRCKTTYGARISKHADA